MNEDLTREMPEQEPTLRQLYSLIVEMRTEMNGMKDEMSGMKDEMSGMNQRLTRLEESRGAALRHRPLWERIISEVDSLRAGQEELNSKFESLREEQVAIRQELAGFRSETNHNLRLLSNKVKDTLLYISDVSARTTELEKHFPALDI